MRHTCLPLGTHVLTDDGKKGRIAGIDHAGLRYLVSTPGEMSKFYPFGRVQAVGHVGRS